MKQPKSKKPKKQRKYLRTAPLHIRRKLIAAHLSKELHARYKIRAAPVRKGDEVEIMRGKFKKRTGKIARVDTKKYKVYIEGMMIKRTDGTERMAPLHASNLKIIKLNLEDKRRFKSIKLPEQKATDTAKSDKK